MKLRRITAAAAIAAALAATTAAVYPRPPADRLQPMPALTARALAARYSADAHQIALAAAAARRAGNTALVSSLAAMRGHQFLDFNPRGPGLAVEVFGNLATATRVAILVPGSDTSLTTFDSRGTASPGGGAAALAAAAHRLDPEAQDAPRGPRLQMRHPALVERDGAGGAHRQHDPAGLGLPEGLRPVVDVHR